MPIAKTILKLVDHLLKGITMLTMASIVSIVGAQVIFRFVFLSPFSWSEEATRYLMVWSLFLGGIYVHMEDGHVRVSYFIDKLPRRLSVLITLLMNCFVIVFFLFVLRYGITLTITTIDVISPALRISKAIAFLSVPVFAFLIILVTLWRSVSLFRQSFGGK